MLIRFWAHAFDSIKPFVILAALLPGCGSPTSPLFGSPAGGASSTCTMGDTGCQCYPNLTCNGSLSCVVGVCVPESSSAGASSASGGAAAMAGDGGTSNAAGTSGSGSGQNDGSGAGGSNAGGTDSTSAGMPGSSAGTTGNAGTSGEASGNLITNGDFSNGTNLWEIELGATTQTDPVVNGVLCINVPSGQLYSVGWPSLGNPGVVLSAGGYVLSYQASTSGPLPVTFTAKVGGAVTYTTDFMQVDAVTSQRQTFSDSFMTATGDPDAGVVFLIQGGFSENATDSTRVCLDNIALAPAN